MMNLIPKDSTKLTYRCPIHRYSLMGVLIIIFLLGGFLVWSVVFPIETAAIAMGTVKVDGKNRVVQHEIGGLITDLPIYDGKYVEKGDVLFKLDNTKIKEQLVSTEKKIAALTSLSNRLMAERDNKNSFKMPDTIDDAELVAIYNNQQSLFNKRKDMHQANLSLTHDKIKHLKEELASIIEHQEMLKEDVKLIQEEKKIMESLAEDDFLEKTQILKLQREVINKKAEIQRLRTTRVQTEQRISDAEVSINQLKADYLQETLQKLRDTQEELALLQEQKHSLAYQLNRTEIAAPISGQIIGLMHHAAGAVVKQGEPVLSIVPTSANYIIEAKVNPNDIDMVHAGLKANIQVTAINTRHLKTLQAEVIQVATDTLQDNQTKEQYYLTYLKASGANTLKLVPGMPVQVMIISDKQTFLEYLLRPLRNSVGHAFKEG